MSIYSLDTLTKEGGGHIAAEAVGVIVGFTLVFYLAIAPALQAVAPEVFVQAGIDYSRTDLPDAAVEYVHLLGSVVVLGGFVYWRLYFTELGATFREAVVNDR
ncbi:hypothetical protein EXE43_04360 [Halorubrum sp. SS5]|nr:hypothetical protein EXE43_04360 [Halorubrum sp. SS5]